MRTAAVILALGCGLTACGGSSSTPKQPAVTAFADGTCRVAAPDVLSIDRDARRLGKGGDVDAAVLTRMTAAQSALDTLASGAEPAYRPALQKLVVQVGLVRLQAHVGTYRGEQGDQLRADVAAVERACGVPAQ